MCVAHRSLVQAYATGRNSKTVNEWLEKHYKESAVEGDVVKQVVVLFWGGPWPFPDPRNKAVRALLEVVESGDGNVEVAVLKQGKVGSRLWARGCAECDDCRTCAS